MRLTISSMMNDEGWSRKMMVAGWMVEVIIISMDAMRWNSRVEVSSCQIWCAKSERAKTGSTTPPVLAKWREAKCQEKSVFR